MSALPEAAYWLALIYGGKLKLGRLKPIVQHVCQPGNETLTVLFEMSELELQTRFGLSSAEARNVLGTQTRAEKQVQQLIRWEAEGMRLVTRAGADYPLRLVEVMPAQQQPLLLWALGPVALLNKPGLTILGADTPDEETGRLLQTLATALAEEEVGLISGYGRGLERAVVQTMLQTDDGTVVAFLPMGLGTFAKLAPGLVEAATAGRVLLVSPYPPQTEFDEKLAQARNTLIDYLALALLVPEAGAETLPRALAALERGASVFVGLTDSPANRQLLDAGALLMTDPGEVIEFVEQAIIDVALQGTGGTMPAVTPAPSGVSSGPRSPTSEEEDFSLSLPDVEPIDAQEALDILSAGGRIPDVLKRRLAERDLNPSDKNRGDK